MEGAGCIETTAYYREEREIDSYDPETSNGSERLDLNRSGVIISLVAKTCRLQPKLSYYL